MQGYVKKGGKFVLHHLPEGKEPHPVLSDEKDALPQAHDEVAVAYCRDPFTIFTHGSRESMSSWVSAHNAHSKHKAEALVFHPDTTVEDINAAIESPEALKPFIP